MDGAPEDSEAGQPVHRAGPRNLGVRAPVEPHPEEPHVVERVEVSVRQPRGSSAGAGRTASRSRAASAKQLESERLAAVSRGPRHPIGRQPARGTRPDRVPVPRTGRLVDVVRLPIWSSEPWARVRWSRRTQSSNSWRRSSTVPVLSAILHSPRLGNDLWVALRPRPSARGHLRRALLPIAGGPGPGEGRHVLHVLHRLSDRVSGDLSSWMLWRTFARSTSPANPCSEATDCGSPRPAASIAAAKSSSCCWTSGGRTSSMPGATHAAA